MRNNKQNAINLRHKFLSVICLIIFVVICSVSNVSGENSTNSLFVENPVIKVDPTLQSDMVLQQNALFHITGEGPVAQEVQIRCSWEGESHLTITDAVGKWSVNVDTPSATNIPQTISATAGTTTVSFTNILIGEVWLCGGQSNMKWKLRDCKGGALEVSNANYPDIRVLNMKRYQSDTKNNDFDAKWTACTPASIDTFSAIGYFFGKMLYQKLKVPIGLINANEGGTPIEIWMERDWIDQDPEMVSYAKIHNTSWGGNGYQVAGGFYNTMIYPLRNMPIAGAIWYQGESNWVYPYVYEKYLKTMVDGWRNLWGNQFAFHICMIAPYIRGANYPTNYANPAMRFVQAKTFSQIENSGITVNDDLVEDVTQIHPRNKKPVGARLAWLALSKTYKQSYYDNWLCCVYEGYTISENRLTVHFNPVSGGLKTNDCNPPSLFEICGSDKIFYPAETVIRGSSVELTSANVPIPVAARMGWSYTKVTNLRSVHGFPVSVFRTYNWTDESEEQTTTP